jgi:putative flippase GtrA
MNKLLVFKTECSTGKAMARYFLLAVPQMLAQTLLTEGAFRLFSIPAEAVALRTLIYAVVMTVLFVASYMIQQRWVFAPNKKSQEVDNV